MGVGILPDMVRDGSVWNGPGDRCTVSDISISSEYIATSDDWVFCESKGEAAMLCVTLHAGEEEYGEKKDRGSSEAGLSSTSESTGVIVGGAGG